MILNGIEEIQKLLPSVNLRLDSTRLDDFMNRAQQWVSDEIIGSDLEDLLEIEVSGSDPHEALRLRVKRVIATKAYLLFGDEMNLQLGEAGMVVQQNQDMAAASSQRRDNLMRSLLERLDGDCDALVGFLMKKSGSEDPYDDWHKKRLLTAQLLVHQRGDDGKLLASHLLPTGRNRQINPLAHIVSTMCPALKSTPGRVLQSDSAKQVNSER